MATVNTFEDLKIWQRARNLCKDIAYLIERHPERLRFFDQLSRSSGSVMDNIAEGYGRSSRKEFIQFLYIANASLMEARSQIYRAYDYRLMAENELNRLVDETRQISAMISTLIKYLKSSPLPGQKHK